jgi:maltose alpha-D-glucosyltransferase/alpha-amylase
MTGPDPVHPDPRPLPELIDAVPPPAALEAIGSYLHAATTLGRRTAEMHQALANAADNPDFAPEALTAADMDALRAEIRRQAESALGALGTNLDRLPAQVTPAARELLERGPAVLSDPLPAGVAVPAATKTRIHGDYHLGQVLWVDNDYVILDFEGEPARSVEERRAKFSPLRDVAGMLRSYHYAAYAGLFAFTRDRPDDFRRLEPWADLWHQWAAAAFLRGYQQAAGRADFVPQDAAEFAVLLDGFVLGKALYELAYELNNRPDWVRIPLRGILALIEPARR